MDTSQVVLIALVVAMIVATVVPRILRSPGRALHKRFVALGTLKGKTRKEIVRAVGEPSSEATLPDGRVVLLWRARGYQIALLFETNGRCFGVTHENGRRVTATQNRGM